MPSALYVCAAAQTALMRRLEALANNVANSSTPGFRADGVKFDTLVSTTRGSRVAFPVAGEDYISQTTGPLLQSGNPLDLAVRGSGWFSLMSPNGPVYTRDGRFTIAATGELQSVNGYPVLDASGAPMLLDPTGGEISVAGDGMLTQRGRQVGAVGLFSIETQSRLARYDNSSVVPDLPATPILDFVRNGVAQGYVEQSNVDPVKEIVRLIEIQRAFENITASMEIQDSTQQDAIKTLGSPG